ncbi:hypothetical protein JL475_34885 [Streptomyces sp. M2CJ-2]|uniref:hypothetical protein n=1 Tax=Streptomyces sp. M2CJ-2 TaxID=2803948 RepID=UPI00192596CF|nr:hypothetical protein [Streptomyces sp. M2CJ-2]MBL3671038.1 hypothetical protein [Streptomyces sp. M2CJ-2]
MKTRRWTLLVTCVVVAVLAGAFMITQGETASRIAMIASTLACVAAVGVGLWSGLSGGGQPDFAVRDTGTARGVLGDAVTGYRGTKRQNRSVTVENTGDADSIGGSAITGYSDE